MAAKGASFADPAVRNGRTNGGNGLEAVVPEARCEKLLRIPRSTLQNWEQGRTAPDSFVRRVIDVIHDDPEGMRQRLKRDSAA